jgi:phosphatidylserine/phosphatidylglycerophosphate/cardiolipin synthase-like enzyme
LEEAQARGVKIRIISDNDKSMDSGSDLTHLSKSGIDCRLDRTDAHMHHKFAISDQDLLLTGSYNWTRAAAAENDENIVITDNPQLVRSFTRSLRNFGPSSVEQSHSEGSFVCLHTEPWRVFLLPMKQAFLTALVCSTVFALGAPLKIKELRT